MSDSDTITHKTSEFTEEVTVKVMWTALPSHLSQTILYCYT
jgi:hypothetical protein